MKKNPFGKGGDFITAPNISRLFSEMVAIWTISFWESIGSPKKFNLIELGAGNGEMMKILTESLKNFPIFFKSCNFIIHEKSLSLIKIQKKKLIKTKIIWVSDINKIDGSPSIFIANEFFDALPIKQFIKKNDNWYERNVKISKFKKSEFVDILTDIKQFEKKIGLNISYKQNFIEFSPLLLDYLRIISEKINNYNGGILIIDYGHTNYQMKNTLQSIYKHKFNNILNNFGNADITYNLNFKLIKKILGKFNLKINGITNQKKFLTNLGILKRAEIISKNTTFSQKADLYYRINRLIDKNLMGELFKVMLATKKNIQFDVGF